MFYKNETAPHVPNNKAREDGFTQVYYPRTILTWNSFIAHVSRAIDNVRGVRQTSEPRQVHSQNVIWRAIDQTFAIIPTVPG